MLLVIETSKIRTLFIVKLYICNQSVPNITSYSDWHQILMFCRHQCFHPFYIFTCYWSLDVAISWFNVVTHRDVIIEEFFCSFQQAMVLLILWSKKTTGRNNKHQCKNSQPFNSVDCQKLQSLLVDFLLRSSNIEKGLTAKLNICICTLEFLSAWEEKNRKTVFSMDAKNKSWIQNALVWSDILIFVQRNDG